MANAWFRFYHEWDSDPKVQMMSEAMQRRLAMLFCARCKESSLEDSHLAFSWRISEEELTQTKALFLANGFIDEKWNLLHWDDRQFVSDSSAERVKKYRDKRQSLGLNRGSSHLSDPFLYERDCNRCIYCFSSTNLCVDHIYPVRLGGTDHYDNLGIACKSCNSGKAGRTPEMAKMVIRFGLAKERYERYKQSLNVTVTDTLHPTVTCSVSGSVSESVSGIEPEMLAKELPKLLGIAAGAGPGSLFDALYEVAKIEMEAGRCLEDVAAEMEAAYRVYQEKKPSLRIQWGAAKFFGDGHWREPPESWPQNGNGRKQKIAAWRAPDDDERA